MSARSAGQPQTEEKPSLSVTRSHGCALGLLLRKETAPPWRSLRPGTLYQRWHLSLLCYVLSSAILDYDFKNTCVLNTSDTTIVRMFFFRYKIRILKLPYSVLEWALNPRMDALPCKGLRGEGCEDGGRHWSKGWINRSYERPG